MIELMFAAYAPQDPRDLEGLGWGAVTISCIIIAAMIFTGFVMAAL